MDVAVVDQIRGDTGLQGLFEWLASSGCIGLNGLRIAPTTDASTGASTGIGCFAKKDFAVGELLFEVPQRCIFGVYEAEEHRELVSAIRSFASLQGKDALVTAELMIWVEMCRQRTQPSQPYFPYFNSLSAQDPTVFSWSEELRDTIVGTNLGASIGPRVRDRLVDQSKLLEGFIGDINSRPSVYSSDAKLLIPPAGTWSVENLTWARGHYLSRRYPGKFCQRAEEISPAHNREHGFQSLGALVPLLDILNHKPGGQWLTFVPTQTSLSVVCNHPIKAGEEMFSNYGDLSNEMLLFAYGFAIASNDHDRVAVTLTSSSDERLGTFYLHPSEDLSGIPKELWRALSSQFVNAESDSEDDGESGGDDASTSIASSPSHCNSHAVAVSAGGGVVVEGELGSGTSETSPGRRPSKRTRSDGSADSISIGEGECRRPSRSKARAVYGAEVERSVDDATIIEAAGGDGRTCRNHESSDTRSDNNDDFSDRASSTSNTSTSSSPPEIGFEEVELLGDYLSRKIRELDASEERARRTFARILGSNSADPQTVARCKYLMWYRMSQRSMLRALLENLEEIVAPGEDEEDDSDSSSSSEGLYSYVDRGGSSTSSDSDVEVPDIDVCARKYGDIVSSTDAAGNEGEMGVEVD